MRARVEQIRKYILKRFGSHSRGTGQSRARQIIPFLVVAGLVIVAVLYLVGQANANSSLSSSGTVEAVEIRMAPEIGGRVVEVLVDEGDQVEEGQPLLRLDDTLLQNQRDQAVAGLAQAEAAVQAAELELESAKQGYDELFDGLDLATAMALQELALARDELRDAENRVDNLIYPGTQTDIDTAQANVVLKRDALDKIKDKYEDYANKPEDNLVRARLQLQLSAAQAAYDNAVRDLNYLLEGSNDIDLTIAHAQLEVAKAQLAQAEEDYAAMESGPHPDQLALAEHRLQAAQAQVDASQANLAAAEAALESADLQIAKAELNAPVAATVLYRNIQPGEIATPNATLIILAQLDNLSITVFLPEDRYGQVNLGDTAEVRVDSFPGETFTATVTHIADEAEFTPRNVQTGEGRRTTVFAIKLHLDDPHGRLKPGMPADVHFAR
ncbi:MAG TPA: efflux RND transporter periplasmic adaptor subunit [Anaerolineales bacterium]|nr:efflux RND transporter periplasmic adaptor subunit [Anaerolineales bacterium]